MLYLLKEIDENSLLVLDDGNFDEQKVYLYKVCKQPKNLAFEYKGKMWERHREAKIGDFWWSGLTVLFTQRVNPCTT